MLATLAQRVMVLGLTGSVGMGKSTAAAMLRRLRHAGATTPTGGPSPARAAAAPRSARSRRPFPGRATRPAPSTAGAGRAVFGDPAALRRLEAILHPLVRAAERRFLAAARARRAPLVVLDMPLLFETGGERRCDRMRGGVGAARCSARACWAGPA